MRFKRILAAAALALVLPLLTVAAHPGRTDSNGGHTDSDTGDYHYHHGYAAHAHFDMDGNGTIDCPYEFDDQTDHSPGTRSPGDYTPGDGSGDGYQEGYSDGYKVGKRDGTTAGYEDGYAEAEKKLTRQADKAASQYSSDLSDLKTLGLKIIGALSVSLLACILLLRRSIKKRKADQLDYERGIAAVRNQCRQEIRELTEAHQLQLDEARDSCEDRVSKAAAGYSILSRRVHAQHTAELQKLQLRLANFRRLEVLELIAKGKDESVVLPDGVSLRPSYTPIRGKTSKRYPYGSYTIFMTPTGKTYHCLCDCVPNARPSHFFDRPQDSTPCRKCVPLDTYPQDLPDWYVRLRKKVESIIPDEPGSTVSPRQLPDGDSQIRFSLEDPQIQFSFKDDPSAT